MSVKQSAENAIFSYPKESTNQPSMQGVADLFGRIRFTFDSVADLLADTDLTYTVSGTKVVAAGDIIGAGGYVYEVVASGSSTNHIATAGSVKMNVLPVIGADYAAAAFGITTGSDQATAIQNAYDSIMAAGGGRLFFGVGTFVIGTSLDFVSGATETFNQGPEIICAGSLTVFDNQVSSGVMFDISAGGTPGTNFLRGGGIKGGKVISTTGTNQVGIRLSTAYQFYLDGMHVDGLDGTGVDVVCTLGDNDGSNMLRMSHLRVENCSGWGVDLKGDSGFNETSFVMMSQCFIQANGTDEYKTITGITQANPGVVTAAAHGFSNGDKVIFFDIGGMVELNGNVYTVANATTNTFEISSTDTTSFTAFTSGGQVGPHVPSSGNMRVKMQMLTMNQCAIVLGENVGMFVAGEAGLGQGIFMYDTTFEHNKKRHILSTGVKALKGKNVQFYSNDGALCMGAIELDASSYTIADVKIDGVVLRATSGNDTYTAFKVYGANADLGTISVEGVNYDDFGYSGQVKQSGFQNDPVISVRQTGALSIGNSIAAVAFDTEVSDLQSRYNAANGRWTINYPTTARFNGKLMITGLTAGDTVTIQLYEVDTATVIGEEIIGAAGLSSETFKFDFTESVGATGLTRNYTIRASQSNSGGSQALDVTNAYNNTLHVRRVSDGAI